jgi:transcriptional regulator with XRE-family HTH domain
MRPVSSRIRTARRAAKLTQAQLAGRIGVGRSAVSQWERVDGSKPGAENLARLALVLSCAFEWLATGRGGRHPSPASPHEETVVVLRHFAKDDLEDHLLDAFRGLIERDKRAVLAVVDALGGTHAARPLMLRLSEY